MSQQNICYELDLFWCTGKAVKNCIAVARVKALRCRSRLGLVGFLTSRVLLVGRVTKATCDVLGLRARLLCVGQVPPFLLVALLRQAVFYFLLWWRESYILGSTILRAMAGVGPDGLRAYGLWSH